MFWPVFCMTLKRNGGINKTNSVGLIKKIEKADLIDLHGISRFGSQSQSDQFVAVSE